ncbi:sulfatase-like hydrolase/transferase [Pseudobutyrivibrio sp.]|uniref:sulfatase-like hydrolase/transferase n=1 Tax=Pseudobutyrivibrio sp. TaxID=2014367 RepID=UPI001DA63DD0|nr:sulfatase-like hydrolase/transferase [Pseudobutyrivibrio sp.]MBE5910021.1 phosphoglycerol transferase [Pseudobutyrivibrio sp.]
MNEENEKVTKSHKIGGTVLKVLYYIFVILLVVLFFTVAYFKNSWSNLTFAEIMFHLNTTIAGTNPDMIISALLKYGLPAVVIIAVIILGRIYLKKKNIKAFKIASVIVMVALILANTISVYLFEKDTHIIRDFKNSLFHTNYGEFVEEQYVDPATVSITFPEKKRNLIYVYMESMESTFSDKENGGAYKDNYIPNLTKISETNDNFSGDAGTLNGGIALPGTNWTSAAAFSQASGLPLQLPVDEGQLGDDAEFFPTVITLGDILKNEGYTNVLEMGSDSYFGAINSYYSSHGDYEIHDYDYALTTGLVPKDYYAFWGYEDEKLFEFAKQEITELAAKGEPFNYTMFTMDTHAEDGYVCQLCDDEYDDQYANVIACSDKQVSEFVEWIQQQDFYDNTTIVLTGDHPTMDSDFCSDIGSYQRKTYTAIINSAVEPVNTEHREYATIDLFPTVLAALGVEMSSDRLGCGTNLYGEEQTLVEEYGIDKCIDEFTRESLFVENLAKVNLEVDQAKLDASAENAYLEVAEDNGFIRFRLQKADAISMLEIDNMKLVVHNNSTGEELTYDIDLERVRAGWHGVVHSEIPFDQVSNLDCDVYITAGDYKDYLLKSFTADEFEMWDIRWDVD